MTALSLSWPLTAALADKVLFIMDIILHIGAQRTATTSFQAYMRAHSAGLSAQGIGYWGPHRTRRGGVLSALIPIREGGASDSVIQKAVDETRDRVCRHIDALGARGKTHLIVSDENMLGTARANVRSQTLYPMAAQRLESFARVFEGIATRVVLSIRAFHTYWPSALAFSVERGVRVPPAGVFERIVAQPRSWRDVIADAARAFPETPLHVDQFERFAADPGGRFAHMVDAAVEPPKTHMDLWLNRSPDLPTLRRIVSERGTGEDLPEGDGLWQPFDAAQIAALRETYADDLFWLHSGADGLASLIKQDWPDETGKNLSIGTMTRGQNDERQDRRMAQAGREGTARTRAG